MLFIFFVIGLLLLADETAASFTKNDRRPFPLHVQTRERSVWGLTIREGQRFDRIYAQLRGGSTEEDEYDEEVSEDEYDSEESSDVDENEDKVADATNNGVQIEMNVQKYDEPLAPSPMINIYATIGVMLLAKRVDLFDPTVVRIARFLFIAYLISLQVFVLYVRAKAKSCNDRTPLTLSSPISSVLTAQLGEQSGMVKNLASSFLSSESTVMEYDLKQSRSMQSGLIFNMLFMWFLHFKMNQVQPLFIQTVTGMANLVYSPLFQVYVLGRNLERPFVNPAMMKFNPISATDSEETADGESSESKDDEPVAAQESKEEAEDSDSEAEDDHPEEATEATKVAATKESDDTDESSDDGSSEDDSDGDD